MFWHRPGIKPQILNRLMKCQTTPFHQKINSIPGGAASSANKPAAHETAIRIDFIRPTTETIMAPAFHTGIVPLIAGGMNRITACLPLKINYRRHWYDPSDNSPHPQFSQTQL
jgi:hypothetical protein